MTTINDKVLYEYNNAQIIKRNNELIFIMNDNEYYISSSPYEPCLYLSFNNKIVTVIHNSFNTSEIEFLAKNNKKINSITGRKYDIKMLCELLSIAVNYNIYDTDISYLESKLSIYHKSENLDKNTSKRSITKIINDDDIIELKDDIFYKEYKKYDECVLDYCIIKMNIEYNHEKSHKKAVIFAMSRWKDKYDMDITFDIKKMNFKRIDANLFFELLSNETKKYDTKPYCELFINPPYGTSYSVKDFKYINNLLFPNGYDNLEIYEWSTNWSNYFDEGLEWWGARCVSIYDYTMNRFIIIGASASD